MQTYVAALIPMGFEQCYWYKEEEEEEEYRYFHYSYREGEVVLENRDWIRLLGMAFVFAQQAERVAMF